MSEDPGTAEERHYGKGDADVLLHGPNGTFGHLVREQDSTILYSCATHASASKNRPRCAILGPWVAYVAELSAAMC